MVDRVEAILAAEERSREQMARQFDSFSNLVSHHCTLLGIPSFARF